MPRTPPAPARFVGRWYPIASRLYWRAREVQPVAAAVHRFRRRRLLLRLRLEAIWYRSSAAVSIAPDVAIGRGVRLTVSPGSISHLRVSRGCLIGDDVQIVLAGGQAAIGSKVDIRQGCRLVVAGRLELAGPNVLQAGCSIHCDEHVVVAPLAVLSEYVTVVDSAHHFTAPDDWVLDNVRTAPISIGYNSWVGAKATISRGARIGDHAIVAANSLVKGNVPDGHLASGVPASVERPIERPWLAE